MTNLILIRHSEPVLDAAKPPSRWELSDRGRRRAELLGEYLATRSVGQIYSSDEQKAQQTANIAASTCGAPVVVEHDLREHEREDTQIIGAEARRLLVIECLRRPDELIYGSEPVATARARFSSAIDQLMTGRDGQTVPVVAHGTVISAYLARLLATDPVPISESLGLPGLVEVEWPSGVAGLIRQMQFE